jgi:hypothetical protein
VKGREQEEEGGGHPARARKRARARAEAPETREGAGLRGAAAAQRDGNGDAPRIVSVKGGVLRRGGGADLLQQPLLEPAHARFLPKHEKGSEERGLSRRAHMKRSTATRGSTAADAATHEEVHRGDASSTGLCAPSSSTFFRPCSGLNRYIFFFYY